MTGIEQGPIARLYKVDSIPAFELVDLGPEETEHRAIAEAVGGPVDIGSCRPFQYAVGEHSVLDGQPPNHEASAVLNRPVFGPVLIWGVGAGGQSVSYFEAADERSAAR